MGSTSSKYFKSSSSKTDNNQNNYSKCSKNVCVTKPHISSFTDVPIVLYRQGSMFFDSDGDLAHEFYVEVKSKHSKKKMKQIFNDLRPQGKVKYPYPRLHPDHPVVLYNL